MDSINPISTHRNAAFFYTRQFLTIQCTNHSHGNICILSTVSFNKLLWLTVSGGCKWNYVTKASRRGDIDSVLHKKTCIAQMRQVRGTQNCRRQTGCLPEWNLYRQGIGRIQEARAVSKGAGRDGAQRGRGTAEWGIWESGELLAGEV